MSVASRSGECSRENRAALCFGIVPKSPSRSAHLSIQRRLAISITLVLLFSLAIGSGLTYQHVLVKVRTEMQAALAVGAYTALNSIDDKAYASDPLGKLRAVVHDFDGDRHLRARVATPDGRVLAQSRLLRPDDAAPAWFYRLVVAAPPEKMLALPPAFAATGTLTLAADPHNEVAEAWSDMRLTLVIMAMFFAAVLSLAFVTIRAALAPLRDVREALLRIGAGDLSTRIAPGVAHELAPLRDGVNAMAERLAATVDQNRALNEQIINLQEEERAELARDLHDEVAPFVFAVGADATMIRQYLAKGATVEIGSRADAISEAVRHMQRHLKGVLRRLAPGALLDLGLGGAIDDLIAFWATRRPSVAFSLAVTGEPLDPPLDAIAFRVVQESVSNAIRHGDPSAIDILIDVDDEAATIVVEDDGRGLPADGRFGFGLAGMRERVRAAGGTITIRNRTTGPGVLVEAHLPIAARAATPERMEALA